MTSKTLWIVSIFFIVVSLIYWVFMRNQKTRKAAWLSVKQLITYNAIILLIIAIVILTKLIFPINKDYGVAYNAEREELGLPIIEDDWTVGLDQNFIVEYMAPPGGTHYKKRIGYDLFGAKYETDYYLMPNQSNTYLYSKFDYSSKEAKYYIENPDGISQMEIYKGQLKFTEAVKTQEISKTEFIHYISQPVN